MARSQLDPPLKSLNQMVKEANALAAKSANRIVSSIRVPIADLGSYIPHHDDYKCPLERFIYTKGCMVVAQGILFDGVDEECYLILARKNGGAHWVWSKSLPAYTTRCCVWRLDQSVI